MIEEFKKLYDKAYSLSNPKKLTDTCKVGMVACVIESTSGKLYSGICAEISCSLGYCAEQAAISSMITEGESAISKLVTVYRGDIIINVINLSTCP